MWCKAFLDCWANQFVMGGYISTVPGAFSLGPTYAAALTGLELMAVKIGLDFTVKNRKYSYWVREMEKIIQMSIGFVLFSGTYPSAPPVPCICNIGVKYEGDDD
jgi:hypothetical protein